MNKALFLSLVSAAIMSTAHFLYMRSIIKGQTKPNKVTWFILTTNTAVIIANQIASGINEAIWSMTLSLVTISIITLLAAKHGITKINAIDSAILAIALMGIAAWQILDNPFASVIASFLTSVVSIIPTLLKLRTHPGSENTSTWLLGAFSMIFLALAVEPRIDFLLIPITWFFLNSTVAIANILTSSNAKPITQ